MTAGRRIHPELRSDVFWNASVGAPLFGVVGVVVVVKSGLAYRAGSLPLGLCLLHSAIGALLLWAASYLWQSRRWHRRVTWLLESTIHVPMRISFATNERGALVAVLYEVSDVHPQEPRLRVLCRRPRWESAGIEGEVVKAYVDPAPQGPVVLHTSRGILWPLERANRVG